MAGHKMCSMACLALACAAESSAGREGDGAGEWKKASSRRNDSKQAFSACQSTWAPRRRRTAGA